MKIKTKTSENCLETVSRQDTSTSWRPILLYGLEVCELNKSQMASLNFTINRFFMKLFSTSNIEIVKFARNSLALNYLALCCPNA